MVQILFMNASSVCVVLLVFVFFNYNITSWCYTVCAIFIMYIYWVYFVTLLYFANYVTLSLPTCYVSNAGPSGQHGYSGIILNRSTS